MIVSHRCLVCRGTTGSRRYAGDQIETWHRREHGLGRTGPFCSTTCVTAWEDWSEDSRLDALYGDAGRYYWLIQQIVLGVYHRAGEEAPAYRYHRSASWTEEPLAHPCPDYDAHHPDNRNREIAAKVCADCARFRLTLEILP